ATNSTRPCASASPWTTASRWTSSSERPRTWPGGSPRATRSCGRSRRRARSSMKRLTREWVQKAEVDYRVARKLAESRPPMHDPVCFSCQQLLEKYLKALLEEPGLTVPRTHDLEDLLSRLLPAHPRLRSLRRGCKFLIQFT